MGRKQERITIPERTVITDAFTQNLRVLDREVEVVVNGRKMGNIYFTLEGKVYRYALPTNKQERTPCLAQAAS